MGFSSSGAMSQGRQNRYCGFTHAGVALACLHPASGYDAVLGRCTSGLFNGDEERSSGSAKLSIFRRFRTGRSDSMLMLRFSVERTPVA